MMKVLAVCLTLAFAVTLAHAKDPSTSADFGGKWVLDFAQTRNPPAGLQDYTLTVNQDAQQIRVETVLVGMLQATPGSVSPGGGMETGSGRRGGGMGMGGRRGGGMGVPRAGSEMPAGGGGGPRGEGPMQGNVAAYQVYPRSVVYKLDGTEATSQFCDPDKTPATSKVERGGQGQILNLSLMGKTEAAEKNGQIKFRDEWQLSADGKYLKLDRTIKSPEGSGTAHMVFCRPEERAAREKADNP